MELNEKIAALEAENAELRKDKERLDFILNHYKFTLHHRDNKIPEIVMSVRNFNKSRNDFIKLIDESINYK